MSLELGGKSPNIVFEDADVPAAIAGATNAIFFNHGQCCNAGSRLYVQRKVFDEVAQGVADAAEGNKLGEGLRSRDPDGAADLGRAASAGDRLPRSPAGAGRAVAGRRQRFGDRGYFFQPTVMVDAKQDMKIVQEEIFGPVVTALPFDDISELAASPTTRLRAGGRHLDQGRREGARPRSRAEGGHGLDQHLPRLRRALPFGGYKESGWGREMGHYALELYTEVKSVVVALPS